MNYNLIEDVWLIAAVASELQCENARLRARVEAQQTAAFTEADARARESRAIDARLRMIEAAVVDLAREGRHPDADALLRPRRTIDEAGRVVMLRGIA